MTIVRQNNSCCMRGSSEADTRPWQRRAKQPTPPQREVWRRI